MTDVARVNHLIEQARDQERVMISLAFSELWIAVSHIGGILERVIDEMRDGPNKTWSKLESDKLFETCQQHFVEEEEG